MQAQLAVYLRRQGKYLSCIKGVINCLNTLYSMVFGGNASVNVKVKIYHQNFNTQILFLWRSSIDICHIRTSILRTIRLAMHSCPDSEYSQIVGWTVVLSLDSPLSLVIPPSWIIPSLWHASNQYWLVLDCTLSASALKNIFDCVVSLWEWDCTANEIATLK